MERCLVCRKSTDTLASAFAQQTGRYGSNHWFRLGLDMQHKHAPVEPMHAIKVVAEHTIKLLNGDEDGAKVRAPHMVTADLFSSGIIQFCTSGMLGDPQRRSLVNFLLLLEEASGTSFDMTIIDSFEQRWHETLCMVERDFPASLQTFYFHLFHHLPQYIRLYGPPRNFWMFPYERYNHTLTEAVSNNKYPELSAIKKVEVQWLITLLDSAGFSHSIKVEA
ncbi:Hypothetical predicted protein [Mytilus galloprovincialis]|uniref:DUF4218 domain-containing protein n=1 Tax=Mytilus galloprovincialis TaxID=29158 RepID=A0A8B6DEY3_MYTGA|nr:Hypothetical predicted protein [Mytilus galloprovincialis]